MAPKRLGWDEYFLAIAETVSRRGTCDRGTTGCVIVKDKRIVATGYVGSPPGMPHCDEEGHLFAKAIEEDGKVHNHCIRTTHAEQNAICQAAKAGVSIDGATLYCKIFPCFTCAKLLVTCGIKRVVAKNDYHSSKLAKDAFKRAGVQFEIVERTVASYPDQEHSGN
ncbi:MAG: cytidine/deoxycytidylate deaminase family protein [archaeon]